MRAFSLCLFALVVLIPATAVAAPPEKEVQGKWEATDPETQGKITLEFGEKNALKIVVGSAAIDGKYKFIDDENLEMTLTFGEMTMTEKVKIKVANGELTITGKDNKPTKFTRPK